VPAIKNGGIGLPEQWEALSLDQFQLWGKLVADIIHARKLQNCRNCGNLIAIFFCKIVEENLNLTN